MILANIPKENADLLFNLMKDGYADAEYINSHSCASGDIYRDVCEMTYLEFMKEHGGKAVFVRDEKEAKFIKEKYNDLVPVVTPEVQYIMMQGAPSYLSNQSSSPKIQRTATPYSILEDFILDNKKTIFGSTKKTLIDGLLPLSREWRIR